MPSAASSDSRLRREDLIGTGLTSEVFSWGEERVLKLFFSWVSRATIQREFLVSQSIRATGVAMPATFELVEIEKRQGIVFERIRGESLLHRVERRPWQLFRGARQLAELHARVHFRCAPVNLPTQHEQLEGWIERAEDFTDDQKAAARRHLQQLPAGRVLCHGDFHPGNILLTPLGPVIIDWSAATRGHALADVARTSVLFESASLPPTTPIHIKLLMKIARRLLHKTYLRRYLELCPGSLQEIEFWRVVQRMGGSAWRAARKAAVRKAETPL